MNWLASVAVRIVLCSAITALAYRALGPIALALCAPLFGVALVKPILEAIGSLPRLAKAARYHGFQGRYHEFKGRQIVVHEDIDGYRWIELDAVRRIVPDLPTDNRLSRLYAAAFTEATPDGGAMLRAEELVAHLGQINQPEALRLRNWLTREVVFPSTKARSRGRVAALQEEPGSRNSP